MRLSSCLLAANLCYVGEPVYSWLTVWFVCSRWNTGEECRDTIWHLSLQPYNVESAPCQLLNTNLCLPACCTFSRKHLCVAGCRKPTFRARGGEADHLFLVGICYSQKSLSSTVHVALYCICSVGDLCAARTRALWLPRGRWHVGNV